MSLNHIIDLDPSGALVVDSNLNLKCESLRVKDSISFSNIVPVVLSVVQENGVSSSVTLKFLSLGDMIFMYIPLLSPTTTTYSQVNKVISSIPTAYRPVSGTSGSDSQSQALVSNQNSTPGIGSCFITNAGVLTLYTKIDRTQPSDGANAIVRPTVFVYFKSL